MIDELIQKHVEEFRKEFRTGTGRKWILTKEESAEIEAHLVRSMKKVAEEVIEEVIKIIKRKKPIFFTNKDAKFLKRDLQVRNHTKKEIIVDIINSKGSITEKGESL